MAEQSGFVNASERISEAINRVVDVMCSLLFGSMTIVVLAGVLFRYVLNVPLSWTEEVSRYLMIWGASVAISMGVKDDEHVGLTILLDALKSKMLRRILSTVIFLLVLGFMVFMLVYAASMAFEARTRYTMALGISMFLPTLAVPVAMALSIAQLVLGFVIKVIGGKEKAREMNVIDI